jgi:hypothetical protein
MRNTGVERNKITMAKGKKTVNKNYEVRKGKI